MENHIGNNIKRLSDEKNIKVQEIAYKWKKSTQQVYNLFKNDDPTASVVFEIARILGVSLNEIYGIEEKDGTSPIKSNSTLQDISIELIETFRQQLDVKDRQIEFYQEMIKEIKK
jgi:transcriptional regulator with XRE-family HTH domain